MKYAILALFVAVTFVASPSSKAAPSNESLTIGMTQEFESLNPLISTMSAAAYVQYMVSRPLASLDSDWKWQCSLCETLPSLENGLATIVERNGKKAMRVALKIREGMKWGDGVPVTAKDFHLAWNIARSSNVNSSERRLYSAILDLELDPADPLKMVFHMKEAHYDFYQQAVMPVPSHLEGPIWAKTKDKVGAYEKQTTYNTDPTNPGLANGPYRITELKLGSHIVLRKNQHWGSAPAPAIKKIIVKIIPNTQTLEAQLLSGTIDLISELGMTFDQAASFDKRIQKDPKLRNLYDVRFREGLTYEHIDLNLDHPALADLRVRKAMMHSFDADKLVLALFEGKQKKATSFLHNKDPNYSPDVTVYPYDLDKARALLKEAGWKLDRSGMLQKDGKKLELTLMTTAGNKVRELVQQYLQAEWRKVGISIVIKNEPARVYFGKTIARRGQWDLAMYANTTVPDRVPETKLHSKYIPNQENGWRGYNYGGWVNAEVDKLVEKVVTEFDPAKRKAVMAQIQKHYTEDVPVFPLYLRSSIAVVPKSLQGMRVSGHSFGSTMHIEKWSIDGRQVSH